MRALIVVLLVVSIFGVTLAFVDVEAVPDQTVVRENDIVKAPLELSKQDRNDAFQINIKVLNRTNLDLKTHNSKKLTRFEPIVKINTTGMVMQSTSYNCGPAALATVLNNLGINVTEQELAILAGTDESGTTMYGLVQATRAKGINATGRRLTVNELEKNSIPVLVINGVVHYSVVNEITRYSVKLADPSLGNVMMPKIEFKKIYTGNALIITNLNSSVLNLNNLTENKTCINSSNF